MKIKNMLFQPLALHLGTDGGGLHLSARECRGILSEHVSEEIRLAARRGLVSLIERAADTVSSDSGGVIELPDAAEGAKPQPEQKKGKAR